MLRLSLGKGVIVPAVAVLSSDTPRLLGRLGTYDDAKP